MITCILLKLRYNCKCGNLMTATSNELHNESNSISNNDWKSNDEFTSESPTNAFGELCFSNTTRITSKVKQYTNKIV